MTFSDTCKPVAVSCKAVYTQINTCTHMLTIAIQFSKIDSIYRINAIYDWKISWIHHDMILSAMITNLKKIFNTLISVSINKSEISLHSLKSLYTDWLHTPPCWASLSTTVSIKITSFYACCTNRGTCAISILWLILWWL